MGSFVALFFLKVGRLCGAGKIPKAVVLEDKTQDERLKLIDNLDEEDKNTVFKIIDKMLTNKKFKEFFDKNLASL